MNGALVAALGAPDGGCTWVGPIYPIGMAWHLLSKWSQTKEDTMKIAITSMGQQLDSPVDPRFGRAQCFIVVDTETDAWSVIDNECNMNSAQGAGIQAAKVVVDAGAEVLITGHVGPKAFSALHAANVGVYTGADGTVAETLSRYRAGQLPRASTANVEGHWA